MNDKAFNRLYTKIQYKTRKEEFLLTLISASVIHQCCWLAPILAYTPLTAPRATQALCERAARTYAHKHTYH